MTTYVLYNRHAPEECEAVNAEALERPFPRRLEGTVVYCGCPSGDHWAALAVEAEDPQDALDLLGPVFRAGSAAAVGGVVTIGEGPFRVE